MLANAMLILLGAYGYVRIGHAISKTRRIFTEHSDQIPSDSTDPGLAVDVVSIVLAGVAISLVEPLFVRLLLGLYALSQIYRIARELVAVPEDGPARRLLELLQYLTAAFVGSSIVLFAYGIERAVDLPVPMLPIAVALFFAVIGLTFKYVSEQASTS